MVHIFLNVVSIFNFIFQFQQRYIAKTSVSDPGSGAFLTPGSGMGRKSASGSGIQHEQPGSYFLELRNHFFLFFFGLKYLNSLMRIRDPGWRSLDPGSGMEKSRIRLKRSVLHAIIGFRRQICMRGSNVVHAKNLSL